MTIDTGLIGKGFGIAALGIGTAIAFESMQNLNRQTKKKKTKGYNPFSFDFPKIRY